MRFVSRRMQGDEVNGSTLKNLQRGSAACPREKLFIPIKGKRSEGIVCYVLLDFALNNFVTRTRLFSYSCLLIPTYIVCSVISSITGVIISKYIVIH